MKIFKIFFSAIIIAFSFSLKAQVAISTDGSSADPSAMLEVKSSQKGFLLPRVRQGARDSINSPAAGLVVWCTNCGSKGEMQVFNGTTWTNMTGGTASFALVCGQNFTDSRDGQSYSTVLIGTQCWMAENLNIGSMVNNLNDQLPNIIIEKYCYDNNTANCDVYGGLYQWNEMMQYNTAPGIQGICPDGWHLPTTAEWTALANHLGGAGYTLNTGGKMKETGTLHWRSPNTGATNESGFTALPGGERGGSQAFGGLTFGAAFWSSTDGNSNIWKLVFNDDYLAAEVTGKMSGLSVRCLRDN